jgi:hypothetical protein
MSVSVMPAQELFGLFELDPAGTVLYYRIDQNGPPGRTLPDLAGQNFYDEVAPFENVQELRGCVTDFVRGSKVVDSFYFNGRYAGSTHSIRVLLARICEQVNRNNTKSVLVHLRRK